MPIHYTEGWKYDLYLLNEATRYKRWLFSLIQPYLGQHILEVGSGIGTFTDMFLDRDHVIATDIDETYVRLLLERFRNNSNVQVSQLDLNNLAHNLKLQDYHLDTIINMNVLEHIKDDLEAMKEMKEVLSEGGRIITIVPAFQKLFGSLDETYGHYRRYSKADFINSFKSLGLSLIHCRYFNTIGILGWIYVGKICRKKLLPRQSVAGFDKWVVPIISVIEKKLPIPVGLSLMAVLQK